MNVQTIIKKNHILSELLEFLRLSICFFMKENLCKRFLQSSDNWKVKNKIDELDFGF